MYKFDPFLKKSRWLDMQGYFLPPIHGLSDQLTSSKLLKEPSGESVASREVDAAAKECDL